MRKLDKRPYKGQNVCHCHFRAYNVIWMLKSIITIPLHANNNNIIPCPTVPPGGAVVSIPAAQQGPGLVLGSKDILAHCNFAAIFEALVSKAVETSAIQAL